MFQITKSTATESRLVVAQSKKVGENGDLEGKAAQGCKVSFGDDETALKLGCGDGCTNLSILKTLNCVL